MDFFYFSCLGWKVQGFIWKYIRKAFFLENIRFFFILELESYVSGNILNFFSANIRKDSFWENIIILLILEPKISISWNIGNFFRGVFLFSFFCAWTGKCARWFLVILLHYCYFLQFFFKIKFFFVINHFSCALKIDFANFLSWSFKFLVLIVNVSNSTQGINIKLRFGVDFTLRI